jgi:hypothetical protein
MNSGTISNGDGGIAERGPYGFMNDSCLIHVRDVLGASGTRMTMEVVDNQSERFAYFDAKLISRLKEHRKSC